MTSFVSLSLSLPLLSPSLLETDDPEEPKGKTTSPLSLTQALCVTSRWMLNTPPLRGRQRDPEGDEMLDRMPNALEACVSRLAPRAHSGILWLRFTLILSFSLSWLRSLSFSHLSPHPESASLPVASLSVPRPRAVTPVWFACSAESVSLLTSARVNPRLQ